MTLASATQRRRQQIVDHLLGNLSDDAREAWDSSRANHETELERANRVHDSVHAQLSRTCRTFRQTKPGVPMHAGASRVSDGRALLMPGPSGCGKSTLVGLLAVRRHASVISDDSVWLRQSEITGVGGPLAIRPGAPLWDQAKSLWYADDSSRLLVQPADLGAPGIVHHGVAGVLIFPSFGPSADLSVLSPAETFCRLMASMLRPCSADELMTLAQLAATLPSAAITYRDADTALGLCDQVLDLPAPGGVVATPVNAATLADGGLQPDVRAIRLDDDVVIWSPSLGSIAQVRDWEGGPLGVTAAARELRSLGLLRKEELDGP